MSNVTMTEAEHIFPVTPVPMANVGTGRKQILHGLCGYAKPGQLMAVMGASGSGKTSFLNVLGQRLGLSPGSKMTGEVRCNDKYMYQNDFGKFGAFV